MKIKIILMGWRNGGREGEGEKERSQSEGESERNLPCVHAVHPFF